MTDIERYVEKAMEELGGSDTDDAMERARAVATALYADIRRDAGEEIAQAIESERFDFTFGPQAPGNSNSFVKGYRRALGAAIRIARAVGNDGR